MTTISTSYIGHRQHGRHGLTLIEVLVATVLLTTLVTTCVSLLIDVRRVSEAITSPEGREGHDNINASALSRLADQFLDDPEVFGVTTPVDQLEQLDVHWPDHPLYPSVTVIRLQADGEGGGGDELLQEVGHGWLVFRCEGLFVTRWISIERSDELPVNSYAPAPQGRSSEAVP